MSTIPNTSASHSIGDLSDAGFPLLSNGDRMSRQEFHRRYKQMPELKKAELLDGVVYIMASPVTTKFHGTPDSYINAWLGVYAAYTPGVEPAGNATVVLDEDNEPQPDNLLRLIRNGSSKLDAEGYTVGPPELAAEISASTRSYDLHVKKNIFRRSAISEYIVWRVLDQHIDWFFLREGQYEPKPVDEQTGLIKSNVFPGLWLDVQAMLRHDMATVLKRLQEGLDSEEHGVFVARLAAQTS